MSDWYAADDMAEARKDARTVPASDSHARELANRYADADERALDRDERAFWGRAS